MAYDLLRYSSESAIAMMFNEVHGTSLYPDDFIITNRVPGPDNTITVKLNFIEPKDRMLPNRFTGSTTVSLTRFDLTDVFGDFTQMDMYYPSTIHDVLVRIMGDRGEIFDLSDFANGVITGETGTIVPLDDSLRWVGELNIGLVDPVNILHISVIAPVDIIDPLYVDTMGHLLSLIAPNPYLGDVWGDEITYAMLLRLSNYEGYFRVTGPGHIPGGVVTLVDGKLIVSSERVLEVVDWGPRLSGMTGFSLKGCNNLSIVPDEIPRWVTNCDEMFLECTSLNDPNIVDWYVSPITSMDRMFSGASKFNQDLSEWCVRNVPATPDDFDLNATSWTLPRPVWGTCPTEDPVIPTTLTLKLTNGKIYTPTTLGPIAGTNVTVTYVDNHIVVTGSEVSEVLVWHEMPGYAPEAKGFVFAGCTNLIGVPNVLPNWVYSTTSMFQGCTNFNGDVSGWNVTDVTSMDNMFASCIVFNRSLATWDMVGTLSVADMFRDAVSFDQDLSMWDVSTITNMDNMFNGTILLDTDLSQWCVTNITSEPVGFSNGCVYMSPDKHPIWGACPARSTLTKPGPLAVKRTDPISMLPAPGPLAVKRVDPPTMLPAPGPLAVKRVDPEGNDPVELPKPGRPAIKRERLAAIYDAPMFVAFKQID